jgi:methylenetetrahydrofolate dehydrogenase (NADP+) / methenyltetrahydrofolate cyclohydrolase
MIIDGKKIAEEINDSLKENISRAFDSSGARPRLISLSVVSSEDSRIYVNMQKRLAEAVGIEFCPVELDAGIGKRDLLGEIKKLNSDPAVTAIIVQKPLPEGVNHDAIVAAIDPGKDAEGIHPYNLGKILRREARIVPCTPGAVMKILNAESVALYGKEVVIIGHSAIVGKPLSLMMLNEMATTTVCHLGTYEKGDIISHARRADILVVAVGNPLMVKQDWVREGAVIIDVGINRVGGRIVGDVDIDRVADKASLITPVPGGVGPVTVSILMRNVYRAFVDRNTVGKA